MHDASIFANSVGQREDSQYPIILYRCTGFEMRLTNCQRRRGNTAQSCGHEGDVGVECNVPDTSGCGKKSKELHNVRCDLFNVRGGFNCIGQNALCMRGMLNFSAR